MSKAFIGTLATIAALAAVLDTPPAWADTIVCESNNGRTQHCPANTHGGVRLVNQYSKQGCYQDDTWGYDRGGIWVSNGCRAQFQTGASYPGRQDRDDNHDNSTAAAALALGVIGAIALANRHHRDHDQDDYRYAPPPNHGYGYRPDQVIRCESDDNRDEYCPARIGRARVEIQRQLSNSACRFNSSWGYDERGIWVDKGCRADFAVLR